MQSSDSPVLPPWLSWIPPAFAGAKGRGNDDSSASAVIPEKACKISHK